MIRLLSRTPTSTSLALVFLVAAALSVAVLIGHDAFLARQRLAEEGIRSGQALGESLLSAALRSPPRGSADTLQGMIEDAGRGRSVLHVVLIGGNGRVVAGSRSDWIGREESVLGGGERREAAVAARASRQRHHRLVDDDRRLVLAWPLPSGSGPILSGGDRGLVYIEIDVDERRRELLANVLKRGVLSVLGAIGFSLCLHLCVGAILTRPVLEAATYARAVAAGKGGPPPRAGWPREVAQLTRDVQRIGSDLRDKDARLRAAEERLAEARRMESAASLAVAAAHDLNNQLTGILGYARMLLDRVGPGDPLRRQLATIENCATRAADLAGRLLALSLPSAGPPAAVGPPPATVPPAPAGPMTPPDPGAFRAAAIDPAHASPGIILTGRKGRTATILAVDDESTVLALAKDILEMHGYEVLTARNGEEALRVFRARRDAIDLVLLDLTMPVMGGRECFREMRRIDPGVRVVISSGFSSESSASDVLGEGAIDFLPKPYDIDCLARTVGEALNRPVSRPDMFDSGAA